MALGISHEGGNRMMANVADPETMAKGLGWFSIGLGLAGLFAPRGVGRLIGAGDDDRAAGTLQMVGLREIASGIGLLAQERPVGWMWSRVAGDVMDLALLGTAFAKDRSDQNRLMATTAVIAGVTLVDLLAAERLSEGGETRATDGGAQSNAGNGAMQALTGAVASARDSVAEWTGNRRLTVTQAVTINRPAEELYSFWKSVENLPRLMRYLDEVYAIDERRSHWVAKGPMNRRFEWDSEITEDIPNQRLAWRSSPGAEVPNSGFVSFEAAANGRGTVVTVELDYQPPGGMIGAAFAKAFGKAPDQEAEEDLRRFKALMETGEILESDATIKGSGAAQPPERVPPRLEPYEGRIRRLHPETADPQPA